MADHDPDGAAAVPTGSTSDDEPSSTRPAPGGLPGEGGGTASAAYDLIREAFPHLDPRDVVRALGLHLIPRCTPAPTRTPHEGTDPR